MMQAPGCPENVGPHAKVPARGDCAGRSSDRKCTVGGSSAMPYSTPEKITLPQYPERDWTRRAITVLQGDGRRSADTHLVNPIFPGLKGISVYLKDESTHPTGSLKHRLARSLFIYGI